MLDRFDRSASTPLKVLDQLYRLPVTFPRSLAKEQNVSYPTANGIIQQLEKAGILKEVSGQRRNRVFFYDKYMSLFDEL